MRMQKRFHPNIMMTPEEEKQLSDLKENMKKDEGVIDYSDLYVSVILFCAHL